jgi:hypothetical protein
MKASIFCYISQIYLRLYIVFMWQCVERVLIVDLACIPCAFFSPSTLYGYSASSRAFVVGNLRPMRLSLQAPE